MSQQNRLPVHSNSSGGWVVDAIRRKREEVMALAPVTSESATRIYSSVLSAIQNNPKLQNCTRESLMIAALGAVRVGLEVSPEMQLAALVPYSGIAQLQIMYAGRLEIARRAGIDDLNAFVIHANDRIVGYRQTPLGVKYTEFLPWWMVEDKEEAGRPRGVVYEWTYKGRQYGRAYPYIELLNNREKSRGYREHCRDNSKTSPWVTDEEQMVIKSGWNRIAKSWPRTPEIMEMIRRDTNDLELESGEVEPPDHSIAEVFGDEIASELHPALPEGEHQMISRARQEPPEKAPVDVQDAKTPSSAPKDTPPAEERRPQTRRINQKLVVEILDSYGHDGTPDNLEQLHTDLQKNGVSIAADKLLEYLQGLMENGKLPYPISGRLYSPAYLNEPATERDTEAELVPKTGQDPASETDVQPESNRNQTFGFGSSRQEDDDF